MDYTRAQQVCHRQIVRFGKSNANPNAAGELIRNGARRDCTVAVSQYNQRERDLYEEGAKRAYISALIEIPPDHEQDQLAWMGKIYRIVLPPVGPRPADIPVFYDCSIVEVSADPQTQGS